MLTVIACAAWISIIIGYVVYETIMCPVPSKKNDDDRRR